MFRESREQLLSATFAHLTCCILSPPLSGRWTSSQQEDTIASFLIRHPTLETLWIEGAFNFESWPSTSARISMPNLQRLRAPPLFLASIVGSQLEEVGLDWEISEPETTFAALKSLMGSDVPFVCCLDCWAHDCVEVVESLVKNMPHTRTLQLLVFWQLRGAMPSPCGVGHSLVSEMQCPDP